jgi:hypothetical protein
LVTWHVNLQCVPSLAWLAGQSFAQQREVLAQLEKAHEQPRTVKRAEARKGAGHGNGATPVKAHATRVKAKCRDPKTRETSSGRDRMATWPNARQNTGERIDKHLL